MKFLGILNIVGTECEFPISCEDAFGLKRCRLSFLNSVRNVPWTLQTLMFPTGETVLSIDLVALLSLFLVTWASGAEDRENRLKAVFVFTSCRSDRF